MTMGLRTASRSYATIEKMASDFRTVLGLSPDAPLPGVTLFESLDTYFVEIDGRRIVLDFACNPLPSGIEALAMHDKGSDEIIVALSPETYADLENDHPRARFSLCHELGHAVLHPRELLALSRIPHVEAALMRGASTHPPYQDTEWQANAFAGALLMPVRGLAQLEREYGAVARIHLEGQFLASAQSADIRWKIYKERGEKLLTYVR